MQAVLNIIGDDLKNVEDRFRTYLESNVPLIRMVGEYVLSSGGKRVRPALHLLAARMCDSNPDKAVTIASVIEFIHTATLLHDDVVDNATLRRGIASANTKWGNETSVLIGDYLFSKSFSLMVECGSMEVLRVIANATTRIAEGEVIQLLSTGNTGLSEKDYIDVIRSKTAVLMSAACETGGLLGDCDQRKRDSLAAFGMELGIAFQLMDDALDYSSSEEAFGKSIGHDLFEGKITLPLIHTLRQCNRTEAALISAAIEKEQLLPDDFEQIFSLVNKYAGIEYTVDSARHYVSQCKSCLNGFNPSPARDALFELADYVVTRTR